MRITRRSFLWGAAAATAGAVGLQQGRAPEGPNRASWVSPGGFHAYEHRWAVAEAFQFHMDLGKEKVMKHIHELNRYCKEGLSNIEKVRLHTPLSAQLSAGIICFDVEGKSPNEVVEALLKRKIVATVSPYGQPNVRLAPGIVNTRQEIDVTLEAIREI